ncbi:molybdate ABC transporter substrate-binding protein [Vibrio sp. V09_P4A23P171]|jgi:molybdate transport system substrate-binding protein|uniref:molybdate ABC transporter substrate-binding protein n=1 Tax=Vibrio TaxID=662 RepID=UPI0002FAD421|nr:MULTISPECIES: molybdate ABC transporter substrate-binding protein [Vibrio]MDQ2165546.1 molybdate ABC transporter substrate-binding protein [Vibrio anguillarum]MDQ2192227.1 molybdate ABC transporter substrate-binding protein [Vibrio sp. A14(2019)]MDQ2196377.1 molybdate ABC transporter substrate-binding protein [Vibrio sp. 2017_1457_11]NAW97588.1 molybdate ABC transporter substrate-binding protein [Vibrio sp. V23_P3S9T160]NNN75577.1 molybdate ABC transporter substrate-binding protein [Vibrio 
MRKILLSIVAMLCCTAVYAQEKITVYAASSMTNAVNELIAAYQPKQPLDIVPVYAGSSALARQIEQGAPADIFISANDNWVTHLLNKNIVTSDKVTLLAGNQLVLIAPQSSKLNSLVVNDVAAWLDALNGSRLAIGNTMAVPVGMYAKEALEKLKVWSSLAPMLAQTNNVRLALALVERQEAALGIVYKTDALMSNKVKVVHEFDSSLHSAIHYPLVQLTERDTVNQFMLFLRSDQAKSILQNYGFSVMTGTDSFAF